MVATGKCDTTKLTKYGNNDFVIDDDIVKKNDDITNGLIFYVPFTDGTAKDIISGKSPVAGYSKVGSEHKFGQGGKYTISWSVPKNVGTFSIMYKYIRKGSTRAMLFGHDGYFCNYSWCQSSGANGFGIWSNVANGGSLSGGHRQWPRGACTSTSGMWTDDYHVATFTYDFSKATYNPYQNDRVNLYYDFDKTAFRIYKDGVRLTTDDNYSMINPDGKILDFITIGCGINSPTSEWTEAYVKDARIYNRCLSDAEVLKLAQICLAKK